MNLSVTGLRVQTIAVFARDLQLACELELEDGSRLPLRCEVVWTSPPDHAGFVPAEIGLAIVDPPPSYIDTVARLFAHSEDE